MLHRSQGPKQFLQNNIWLETVFVSDSKELQDAAAEAKRHLNGGKKREKCDRAGGDLRA